MKTLIELPPSLCEALAPLSKHAKVVDHVPDSVVPVLTASIKDILADEIRARVDEEDEDAFFVGDVGVVVNQFWRWKRMLPRVEPFYGTFSSFWWSLLPYFSFSSLYNE
jgi:hypothetical protein